MELRRQGGLCRGPRAEGHPHGAVHRFLHGSARLDKTVGCSHLRYQGQKRFGVRGLRETHRFRFRYYPGAGRSTMEPEWRRPLRERPDDRKHRCREFRDLLLRCSGVDQAGKREGCRPEWNGFQGLRGLCPPHGSVRVDITGTKDGRWSLDGKGNYPSGWTAGKIVVGTYKVLFSNVSGSIKPEAKTITVKNGVTTTLSAAYTPNTGSVTVTIDGPKEARWSIDGRGSYQSGQTVGGVIQGNHTISFSYVKGWKSPADRKNHGPERGYDLIVRRVH